MVVGLENDSELNVIITKVEGADGIASPDNSVVIIVCIKYPIWSLNRGNWEGDTELRRCSVGQTGSSFNVGEFQSAKDNTSS